MEVQVDYRDVPGFPGYRIGSDGTLLNVKKGSPKQLKGSIEHTPYNVEYRAYFLIKEGKQHTVRGHRLVASAFFGPCPDGCEVRHINGNGLDNSVGNLAYGTRSENIKDRDAHGTMIRGESHQYAKISDQQVEEIRRLSSEGVSRDQIADQFGISSSYVYALIKRIWRRLPAHA